jgi:hypothetical protein
VGGHQYPPGSYVGIQTTPKVYNPQLKIIRDERVELKLSKGASWNRWVATNIHLDQQMWILYRERALARCDEEK